MESQKSRSYNVVNANLLTSYIRFKISTYLDQMLQLLTTKNKL